MNISIQPVLLYLLINNKNAIYTQQTLTAREKFSELLI